MATGTSTDFGFNNNVDYSYTIELPYYSFILDSSKILPIGQDIWSALKCVLIEFTENKINAKEFCNIK